MVGQQVQGKGTLPLGVQLFSPLLPSQQRASGKAIKLVEQSVAGENLCVAVTNVAAHIGSSAASFSTAGAAVATLRDRSVRSTPAVLCTIADQPLKYKNHERMSHVSPNKDPLKPPMSPRCSTAVAVAKSGATPSARTEPAIAPESDAALAKLMSQNAVEAIAAADSTAAVGSSRKRSSGAAPGCMAAAATTGSWEQQNLPSSAHIKQEWQKLQQRHLSGKQLQQQTEQCQQKLLQQFAMLQEQRMKQKQHQQGDKRSRLHVKSYSSAYSLRSRTLSPLRNIVPPGHQPKEHNASAVRLHNNSSQAAPAPVRAVDVRGACHTAAGSCNLGSTSAAATTGNASAAHKHQHQQVNETTAVQARDAVKVSGHTVFASKLHHLKTSNQRLRAPWQQPRQQVTAPAQGVLPSKAAATGAVQEVRVSPRMPKQPDELYTDVTTCSSPGTACTHMTGAGASNEIQHPACSSSHAVSGHSCAKGNASSQMKSNVISSVCDDAGDTNSSGSFGDIGSKPQQVGPKEPVQPNKWHQHGNEVEHKWEQHLQHWHQQQQQRQDPQQPEHQCDLIKQTRCTRAVQKQQLSDTSQAMQGQQHQQHEPAEGNHRQSRVRTALFLSPRKVAHDSSSSSIGSLSDGSWDSSTDGHRGYARNNSKCTTSYSNSDRAAQHTIAAVERELQLLLNDTGKQGHVSPVARWEVTAALAHKQHVQQQQQDGHHIMQGMQLEAADWPVWSTSSSISLATAVVGDGNVCAADKDAFLQEAEESFLLLLTADVHLQQQQGQLCLQPSQQQHHKQPQKHSPPWRPPGKAIMHSSSQSRSGSHAGASKKQHLQQGQQQTTFQQQASAQVGSVATQCIHKEEQEQVQQLQPPVNTTTSEHQCFSSAIAAKTDKQHTQQGYRLKHLLAAQQSDFAEQWMCHPYQWQQHTQQPQNLYVQSGSNTSGESLQKQSAALKTARSNPPAPISQQKQVVHHCDSSKSGSSIDSTGDCDWQQLSGSNAGDAGLQPHELQPPYPSQVASSAWSREQRRWQRPVLGSANSSGDSCRGSAVPVKQNAMYKQYSSAEDFNDTESKDMWRVLTARAVLQEWSYLAATSEWQQLMQELDLHDKQADPQAPVLQGEQHQPIPHNEQHNVQQQQQRVYQQILPTALQQMHVCLKAWQDEAEQSAATAALQEQQWASYHGWRLLMKVFRSWRDASSMHSWRLIALEEQAVEFKRLQQLKRCFRAWRDRYIPACHVQHLLMDAAAVEADDFAAARMQRLLARCLAGWTAAVLVRGSARAAACETLQRTWLQKVLQDWHMVARQSRQLKKTVLTAWRQTAAQEQIERAQAAVADGLAAQLLISKAWRSWVVAWCRSASARVFARHLQAKQQARVLAALSEHVHQRRHKRASLAAAERFRRGHMLPLCLRWWHAWAVYSRVLSQAGTAVQQAARTRVLHEMLRAWRNLAAFKAWERSALETAEGFYWSRLAASHFYCWRAYAAQQHQQRLTGQAAAEHHSVFLTSRAFCCWKQQTQLSANVRAMAGARQTALLKEVLGCWWAESVGAKQAFEFQVSCLVQLVTRCFSAWRQLLAVQQLHGSRLVAHTFDSWQQQTAQGRLLQQQLEIWQHQQGASQQLRQLRSAFFGWRHVVVLTKGWRGQAPLLAAAYYQERLLWQAWAVWRGQREQLRHEQLVEPGLKLGGQPQQHQPGLQPCNAHTTGSSRDKLLSARQQDCSHTNDSGPLQQPADSSVVAAAAAVSNSQCVVPTYPVATAIATVQAPATASANEPSFSSEAQSWWGWQQQQHEQQLELLQLQASQLHWRAVTSRKALLAWLSMATLGAAVMSEQAQLKHLAQLELLERSQRQQAAVWLAQSRLLMTPFRAWQQLTAQKRSAAAGFMCYNSLLQGFVGWRAVSLERQVSKPGYSAFGSQQLQQQADQHTVAALWVGHDDVAYQPQQQQQQEREQQQHVEAGFQGMLARPAATAQVQRSTAAACVQLSKETALLGTHGSVFLEAEALESSTQATTLGCKYDDVATLHGDQLPQMPYWWHQPDLQQQQQHQQQQHAGGQGGQRPKQQGDVGALWGDSDSSVSSACLQPLQPQWCKQQHGDGLSNLEGAACLQDLHDAIMGLV